MPNAKGKRTTVDILPDAEEAIDELIFQVPTAKRALVLRAMLAVAVKHSDEVLVVLQGQL